MCPARGSGPALQRLGERTKRPCGACAGWRGAWTASCQRPAAPRWIARRCQHRSLRRRAGRPAAGRGRGGAAHQRTRSVGGLGTAPPGPQRRGQRRRRPCDHPLRPLTPSGSRSRAGAGTRAAEAAGGPGIGSAPQGCQRPPAPHAAGAWRVGTRGFQATENGVSRTLRLRAGSSSPPAHLSRPGSRVCFRCAQSHAWRAVKCVLRAL